MRVALPFAKIEAVKKVEKFVGKKSNIMNKLLALPNDYR
ncbi:hypothetical protein Cyrtocomes_00856 [Candidatus Cyrtobacter comes]|uniref:Uncharacterized protein n=1 Tax=Candidatus Cyrtobacter comes TaxID=675776 RepID=A0ABU5L8V9_9RICK|nr:hypothetical protein [Candidatus Cyrtobacter comes]